MLLDNFNWFSVHFRRNIFYLFVNVFWSLPNCLHIAKLVSKNLQKIDKKLKRNFGGGHMYVFDRHF